MRDLCGGWRFRSKIWCFNRTFQSGDTSAHLKNCSESRKLPKSQPRFFLLEHSCQATLGLILLPSQKSSTPTIPPASKVSSSQPQPLPKTPGFFRGKILGLFYLGHQETSRDLLMLFFFQGPGNGHFRLQGHETIEQGLRKQEKKWEQHNPGHLAKKGEPGVKPAWKKNNNLGMFGFSDVTLRFLDLLLQHNRWWDCGRWSIHMMWHCVSWGIILGLIRLGSLQIWNKATSKHCCNNQPPIETAQESAYYLSLRVSSDLPWEA